MLHSILPGEQQLHTIHLKQLLADSYIQEQSEREQQWFILACPFFSLSNSALSHLLPRRFLLLLYMLVWIFVFLNPDLTEKTLSSSPTPTFLSKTGFSEEKQSSLRFAIQSRGYQDCGGLKLNPIYINRALRSKKRPGFLALWNWKSNSPTCRNLEPRLLQIQITVECLHLNDSGSPNRLLTVEENLKAGY